ncbi:MAG: hypothetical protein IJN72_01535 [Firmicutes bacterium]|nr:hypothetical protein [Bacillota bacterium]
MKKFLITMMCVIMVIAMMPAMAFATETEGQDVVDTTIPAEESQEETSDEVTGLSGEGTEANPYLITKLTEFKWFRDAVNAGNSYSGKHIRLENNLDLNSEEWIPIGNSTNKFQGTFDGNYQTISNLVITGNNSYVGLFGFTTNGEIKNLTLNNASVSGYLGVGALAGSPYTSKYTNIMLTGHVEINGFAYVGGVGGRNAYANWTDVTVDVDETSYVNANSIEGDAAYRTYVGGVIGFCGEGGHSFTNLVSNIDVIGSTIDAGGIVGIAHYGNSFINCASSGDVTLTDAGEAADAEEIGGIAGVWNNGGDNVTFKDCSFTGTLSANITEGVDLSDNTITGKAYSTSGPGELVIEQSVAKVGDVGYSTLQEAIDVADGGVVTLLQNIKLNTTINILDGKTVTLNLNGYNLNSEVSNDGKAAALIVIKPTGNLTIKGTGTLGFVAADPDLQAIPGYATNTITNEGTLTIENGVTITNGSNGGASYAVDDKGTFIMNGGALVGERCALRVAKYNQDNVSFVMNGGTITAATPMWIQLPGSDSNVTPTITVTINNGTIQTTKEANADNSILYTYSYGNSYKKTTVNINGGNFLGGTVNFGSGYKGDIENVTISGGKFAFVPGRWVTSESFVDFTNNEESGITVSKDIYKFASGTYAYEVASKAPANSSGMNTWTKGTDGIYTESYVAPYIPPVDPTPVTPAPSTPKDDVVTNETTNTGAAGETVVAPTTNADVSASTTTTKTETGEAKTETKVEQTTADKIVESAVANKSEEVVIDATTAPAPATGTTTPAVETTEAAVTIPTATIETIAQQTEAAVTIKTDVAEIKLDNTAAAAIAEQAAEDGTISIVAVKTDEKVVEEETTTGEAEKVTEVHFELKVVCSERGVIGDFQGGTVTVTVPVPEDMHTEELVAVYIDAQGHYHRVTGVKNANGTFTFTTDHFSSYAVMTAEEAEKAIAEQKAKVESVKLKLRSANSKTSKGKKAIKLTVSEVTDTGIDFDGYVIYRSTKKTSGFKKIYTTKTGTYYNTSAKKGVKYYYKAKGFVTIDGEKVYTGWSKKAIRTAK